MTVFLFCLLSVFSVVYCTQQRKSSSMDKGDLEWLKDLELEINDDDEDALHKSNQVLMDLERNINQKMNEVRSPTK